MVKIIDGKGYAQLLQRKLAEEVRSPHAVVPSLAVVLVGEDRASQLYVGLKKKASEKAGMHFHSYLVSEHEPAGSVMQYIHFLVEDEDVDAIVLQLPLPGALADETEAITRQIHPEKDVDGFHPDNVRRYLAGEPGVLPPGLVEGMVRLVQLTGEQLRGKHAVLVAKWPPFVEALSKAFQDMGVDTEWVKPDALDLSARVRTGDIVLTAAGRAGLITGDMVKPGAIIIDMGTNHVAEQLVGDVDAASVADVAGWITPVPGGVGPETVAMLLWRAYQLACRRRGLPVPEIPRPTLAEVAAFQGGQKN
jgi:methylenetetrahydrofolate dehydrogenase (NADP+)/methenyltetrahydrofolate cyclohydrolase